MSTTNPICCWDFTLGEAEATEEEVITWCKSNCKKWCFQLEEGVTTGFRHWQGRVSLNEKTRNVKGKLNKKCHWSPTLTENINNFDYVSKDFTRIGGPWKYDDVYIPRQYRDIKLWPWQQHVLDSADVWDTRTINFIHDEPGNSGKSTLVGYGACRKLLRAVPVMDSYKDLMRFVYDVPSSKMYIIDVPKAMTRSDAHGFWSAIESIKNGYCYDDRYHFKEKWFDSPTVWVFGNFLPDKSLLSRDRWAMWEMTPSGLRGPAGNTILNPTGTTGTDILEPIELNDLEYIFGKEAD